MEFTKVSNVYLGDNLELYVLKAESETKGVMKRFAADMIEHLTPYEPSMSDHELQPGPGTPDTKYLCPHCMHEVSPTDLIER